MLFEDSALLNKIQYWFCCFILSMRYPGCWCFALNNWNDALRYNVVSVYPFSWVEKVEWALCKRSLRFIDFANVKNIGKPIIVSLRIQNRRSCALKMVFRMDGNGLKTLLHSAATALITYIWATCLGFILDPSIQLCKMSSKYGANFQDKELRKLFQIFLKRVDMVTKIQWYAVLSYFSSKVSFFARFGSWSSSEWSWYISRYGAKRCFFRRQ